MALSTYPNLLDSLATFSLRTDQPAVWPDCVRMAELDAQRKLRVTPMVSRNASFSLSAITAAIPSDLVEVMSFMLTSTSPYYQLDYVIPAQLAKLRRDNLYSDNIPRWYTRDSANFVFYPTPISSYTAELVYFRTLPDLATNSTNWLLTSHPDVYLYGSLVQFGIMTGDERLAGWTQLYQQALEATNAAYSNGTNRALLKTDTPTGNRPTSFI